MPRLRPRFRLALCGLTIVHALAAAPLVAAAAPSVSSADPRTTGEARKRFEEGKVAYKRGDFEGARLAFQQAFAILHSTDVLMNLALSELAGGYVLDALKHFRQYRADPRADPKLLAALPALMDQAHRRSGHIHVSAPPAASVRVDDDLAPSPLPDEIDVAPGAHAVVVKLGDDEQRQQLVAPAGDVVRIDFSFADPAPAPIAASPALVTPVREPVRASSAHFESRNVSTLRTVATIGFGVAAIAAVGAGAGFQIAANDHANNVRDFRERNGPSSCATAPSAYCDARAHELDTQRTDAQLATGLFIGGGILAAGAVISWLALRPSTRADSAAKAISPPMTPTVTPIAAPGFAGLTVRSSF